MKTLNLLIAVWTMHMFSSVTQASHIEPKFYTQNSMPQVSWAFMVLDGISFKGDEHIIDFGCGNGTITSVLAQNMVPNGQVHGLDVSHEMIEHCQLEYKGQNNLRFRQADAQTFVSEEPADYVVSFSAMHWVKGQVPALKRIKASLKPGGKAVLSLSAKPWPMTPAVNKAMAMEKWQPYFKDYQNPWFEYDPNEYTEFLKEAGLAPLKVEIVPRKTTFKNKESFITWNIAWMPQSGQLPDDKKHEFAADVVDWFLKMNPQDNISEIVMKGGALVVIAQNGP